MEKSLVKFIFEQQNRMSCIIRYNNTPKLGPESVAEHSYYVTMMSMLIADYLNSEKNLGVNTEKLLKMALVHDMEEIISGDIIKVLKSGGFKDELNKMNRRAMHFMVDPLEHQGEQYFELWTEAKAKESIEAKIVDIVDWFAVVVYSVKEIHLGNKYFKEILEFAVKCVLRYGQDIKELKGITRAFADYALGYLLEDKKIYEDINKAVRIYSDSEKY